MAEAGDCPFCAAGYKPQPAMTVIDHQNPDKKTVMLLSEGQYQKIVSGMEKKVPVTDATFRVDREPAPKNLAELVVKLGFTDEREFHRMVSSADISTPAKYGRFRYWQDQDGSKAGLERLLLENGKSP